MPLKQDDLQGAHTLADRYLDFFDAQITAHRTVPNPMNNHRYTIERDRVDQTRFPDRHVWRPQQAPRLPVSSWSQHVFVARPNGPILVVEARVLMHSQAVRAHDFDEASLGFPELAEAVDEAVRRGQKYGTSWSQIVALASVTGWSSDALDSWRQKNGFRFESLVLMPVDLKTDDVIFHWHELHRNLSTSGMACRLDEVADIFGPHGELGRAVERIDDLSGKGLLRTELRLPDVVERLGLRPSLVLRAFKQLRDQGSYRLINAETPAEAVLRYIIY